MPIGQRSIGLTAVQEAAVDSIPDVAISDFISQPDLLLTDVETIVPSWSDSVDPVGIIRDGSRFTVTKAGMYFISLERTYLNIDKNPLLLVNITITVKKNGESVFTRTQTIGSATANDEPGVLSFTSNAFRRADAGDYFEVFVSALDGVIAPVGTSMTLCRMLFDLRHK